MVRRSAGPYQRGSALGDVVRGGVRIITSRRVGASSEERDAGLCGRSKYNILVSVLARRGARVPAPAPLRKTRSRKRSAGPSSTRRRRAATLAEVGRRKRNGCDGVRRGPSPRPYAGTRTAIWSMGGSSRAARARSAWTRGREGSTARPKPRFNFHSARPLKRQPLLQTRRAEVGSIKAPSNNTNDDTHVYHQSGKNLILERNETREEVIVGSNWSGFERTIERRSSSGKP